MSTLIWLREKRTGRLEREVFGYTPFADVPESPYYVPSPGSHLSTRAWVDEDGQHVVMAHDCTTERKVHILRWPTWQALGNGVDPSVDCGDCGLHTFVPLAYRLAPPGPSHYHREVGCPCENAAPAPAGDSGGERGAAPAAADDAGRP